MQRRRVFVLLASAAISGASVLKANPTVDERQSYRAHMAWVAEVLKRMETIHPGMTRESLLNGFHHRRWIIYGIAAYVRKPRLSLL